MSPGGLPASFLRLRISARARRLAVSPSAESKGAAGVRVGELPEPVLLRGERRSLFESTRTVPRRQPLEQREPGCLWSSSCFACNRTLPVPRQLLRRRLAYDLEFQAVDPDAHARRSPRRLIQALPGCT